jgi:predicted small secreted protein
MEIAEVKKIAIIAAAIGIATSLTACNDADVASRNLSTAADNFQIERRIVFYNGITGEYMLTVEGLCSLGNADKSRELTITCKTGSNSYKKHFLGLSDNVTYFVEQMEGADVSAYHYKVVFKPSVIVPDISIK